MRVRIIVTAVMGCRGHVTGMAHNTSLPTPARESFSNDKGPSAPRWQEALSTYRAISMELLASLRVSYLGPPLVPYLKWGGEGVTIGNKLGNMSGRARINTLTRSLAMSDFAKVASADTPGLTMRRRQLFLESWGEACIVALTYISADFANSAHHMPCN